MQARRIAREIALLSLSQLSPKSPATAQDLKTAVAAAVQTLSTEAQEALETAAEDLKNSHDRLLESEIRAASLKSARTLLTAAIESTQTAINRVGSALELPELLNLANQPEVQEYVMQILNQVGRHRTEIDQLINDNLVDWQLSRLARIDQDILRTAVVEIQYLGTPERVAINEAIEIAKRYSEEDGYRFINGVLRRISNALGSASS